jgi:hypothetical protein
MWKNMIFWLWEVKKGTSSLHREMEMPSKQFSWGEAKFSITVRTSCLKTSLIFLNMTQTL